MRRRLLVSLGGGLVLLVVSALALGWYALGEERRAGRLLSRVLSRELGVPIRVERARAERARLTLRGVSVPPGPHWGGRVEIRELRVEGGVLPVVLPRGRAVSVVAVSTLVTLAAEPAPLAAPAADTLTAIRTAVLHLLEWPGALSLEVKGGELHAGPETFAFDLRGEKTGDGKLTLRLEGRGPGGPPALALEARGSAAGRDIRLALHAEGDPRRLGSFWPSTLTAPVRLTADGDLALSSVPELEGTGAFTVVRAEGAPLAVRLAARYRPLARRVEVPLLALRWEPGLALDLAGSAEELGAAARLTVKASGTMDGSRVTGEGTYAGASGDLRATVDLRPVEAGALLARLGYPRPAFGVKAQSAGLALEGTIEGPERARLRGTFRLDGLDAPPWGPGARLGADGRFDATLARRDGRVALGGLTRAEVTLASPSGEVARVSALPGAAATGSPWPLAVEAVIPDLSRLPALEALSLKLGGESRLEGALEWSTGGARFSGRLTARVPRGEVDAGGPIVVSGLQASIPLAWGPGEEAPAGSVAADSLTAFGFVLRGLTSPVRMRGTALALPEIRYAHYRGTGKGSARLDVADPVPLTLTLEGEGVDLATLTREYGLTVGRITGTVRYRLALEHSRAHGLVAGGHVASERSGGEVNIEAIKKLLAYAESDPSGILKRALESLSAFSYESLAGDIRVGSQGGRVSLSLQGRKRFGLFPGPVRAINFENIPLSLLVRIYGQPRRETP